MYLSCLTSSSMGEEVLKLQLINDLIQMQITYVSERDLKGCVAFSLHYGNPERFGLLAFFFPLSMKHITVLPG